VVEVLQSGDGDYGRVSLLSQCR